MKLREKMAAAMSLTVIGIIALMSFILLGWEREILLSQEQEKQIAIALGVAKVAQQSLLTSDQVLLYNFLRERRGDHPELERAFVTDAAGRILAHHDLGQVGGMAADPLLQRALRAQGWASRQDAAEAEFAVPVRIGGRTAAAARVVFSTGRVKAKVAQALAPVRRGLAAASSICVLLALVLSAVLAEAIARPVRAVSEAAAGIGEGRLDPSLPEGRRDELGDLARQFNRMARQLKELDEMKRDFVSSVTHEFRAPLSALSVYVDLLRKDPESFLSAEQHRCLEIMQQNLARLGRFINDLLDIAKIERGRMEVHRVETSLRDALRDSLALMRGPADQRNIRLEAHAPAGALTVLADPDRLQQILTNLLSNAIKFTPAGGTVRVSVEEREELWKVAVRDSGCGIPADQLPQLFQKFVQLRGSRAAAARPGTGLGLAIVKHLVEAHEGGVGVESEPGRGSVFSFTLSKNGKGGAHG